MLTPKFAETHNLVAFLEKPEESNGFEGIINFLNASSIKYALTIQALVDKKKVIISEKSVRSDLMLEDAEGTECLPNDVIFEQMTLMRNDEDLMFDTDVLNCDEVFEEPIVNAAMTTISSPVIVVDPVTTVGEVVTTASATTTVDELTLAQTLIEIKAAKPKAITTAATTITTVVANPRPKAKGIIFHDQEEQAPTFT
ncbi:hypothetical protein Tco_0793841 [Tanacetum coccineum]